MTVSNVLVPFSPPTAAPVIQSGLPTSDQIGSGARRAARPLQIDAARPIAPSPKDGDQSATSNRGPAAIVKISQAAKAAAQTNANTPGPRLANELSDEERASVNELKV